ncbi:hypothetical protein HPP92_004923 [Vanilla planifolia]|uniref:tRNA(Ile)-lysidine synthetase n=1 Tax=Vanilla planifolia TaxID=51239 RepID=A0A835VAV1_VANPL|nr:hypothetical protein HPP92_004923 [Vanilla planifolia]
MRTFLRRLKCSATGISFYRESFSRRMAMAGLKRHHRIAIGVSGGPDSMALCALTAWWKSEEPSSGTIDALGYLDGLLGIIVDHRLRPESSEEARVVQERVMKMGIRCKIGCCNWSEGRPKLGHLLEASREMRDHMLQEFCLKEKINILLVAHHADDQAELFILRLSRNSGVLGLAGMPFVSQLFLQHSSHWWSASGNHLILLVRPMLEFSKDDIYKICHGGQLTWVEDPTNLNSLFAETASHFIGLTRTVIENSCRKMLKRCVSVMDEGYTIINLEKLDPLNINDLYLSKFLDVVLQFTSQRLRPIRGSAMRLLLGYVRSLPCKMLPK